MYFEHTFDQNLIPAVVDVEIPMAPKGNPAFPLYTAPHSNIR